MRTLVVQAHPVPDSFNAAILDQVHAGLATRPEVDVTTFRLGAGERPRDGDLDGVQRLVLIYPTWWGGQPAMLMDWLHEVVREESLRTVTQVVAVTTCGSSLMVNTVQGQWGKRWLRRQLLSRCDQGATFDWLALYKMDRLTPERADGFLSDVHRRFSSIPTASPSPVERLRHPRRRQV